jgi:hypothetical protein
MLDEANIGQATAGGGDVLRYKVVGMDCPSCVTKIERFCQLSGQVAQRTDV